MSSTNFEWGITVEEVLSVVGQSPSPVDADPSYDAITTAIRRFCGLVNDTLYGVTGVEPSSSVYSSTVSPSRYYAARGVILGRVAAEWYINNQRQLSEYAQYLVEEFNEYLTALRNRPSLMLGDEGHTKSISSGSEYGVGPTTSSVLNRAKDRRWIDDDGFG